MTTRRRGIRWRRGFALPIPRYRTLVEQAAEGVMLTNGNGTILEANALACQMLGYTREELLYSNAVRLLHPDDVRQSTSRLDILGLGNASPRERRMRRKDGTFILVEGRRRPLHSSRSMLILRDITALRQTEEARKKLEERFRIIYDSGLVGIVISSVDGKITECNDEILRMVGAAREELTAGSVAWFDFTPPEYIAKDLEALEQLKTGTFTPYEKQIVRSDGTRIHVLVGGAALIGDVETIACIIDTSRLTQAEAAVREWKERYEMAVLASGQLLYDCNTDLNEVVWAGDVERILGYTIEEMETAPSFWSTLVHPDDLALTDAHLVEAHARRGRFRFEYRMRRKDGQYIQALSQGSFFAAESGGSANRIVGFIEDISERKRIDEARSREEELARAGQAESDTAEDAEPGHTKKKPA